MEIRITAEYFNNWVRTAKPGWELVYHVGHLAFDRETVYEETGRVRRYEPQHSTGNAAYAAYEDGLVELFQKRISENRWHYIARRRP